MTDEGLRRVAVVVEDDADIRNLLEAVLTQAGFETHTASNGLDGVEQVRAHDPAVTTLDISLPGIDGFEVARRIRAFSPTYIVMLTARNDEIDTLVGLDAGADDYVTKPFRPRELRARIEAMMRRPRVAPTTSTAPTTTAPITTAPITTADAGGHASATASAADSPRVALAPSSPAGAGAGADAHAGAGAGVTAGLGAGESGDASAALVASDIEDLDDDWITRDVLRLSPSKRLVELDGARVDLTRTEFELLLCIMSNGSRVVSKSTLATAMRADEYDTGGYVSDSDRRTVEVHLANLRRKLGDSSARPRWIETVRGVGYRLAN
ncbi:response regulator transcription factor [Rathayibacter soli]|uniref:response regulator transcription factor n=1 Tax=Rathayibacter soli TaxID=3144168 RepID=UPI0027E468C0|nr:response regulator transcription factor [Glaciibacter superstes]